MITPGLRISKHKDFTKTMQDCNQSEEFGTARPKKIPWTFSHIDIFTEVYGYAVQATIDILMQRESVTSQ